MQTFDEVIAAIKQVKTAVVCSHVAPDPDAIGSSAAFQLLLSELGVAASFYLPEPAPERMRSFLEGVAVIHEVPSTQVDALIVLDTASQKRISGPEEELIAMADTVINIDHHPSNIGWGDVNFIRGDAASTSIIVLQLLEALGAPLTPVIAQLLLSGLVDDTGSFRFSNANVESFETAAKLVRAGASPTIVANELYFSMPERVLTLRAKALSKLRVTANGQIASVTVSAALLEECGASAEDTEGLVDYARSVEGTRAAAFFREMSDGWKVSLRAKDERLDVNAIAGKFGGGGHRAAAGCKVSGSMEEVQTQVLAALEKALAEI